MENTMVVCANSGSNGGGDTGRRHHRHHYQHRDIGINVGGRANNGGGAASAPATAASSLAEDVGPQLFCLRWNNYQTNLTNVFDQLLQNESFVDVTLACADGHTVKAHKMVLSACSPYFQSLFYDNPCKHPIVIMKDIKWNELKAAIEFMYKGEINICQEQIGPLLKVAESLKIRGLADVNSEHELAAAAAAATASSSSSSSSSSASTSPVQRQSPALASVAVSAALAAAAAAVTDPHAVAPRRANLSDMISSANRKRRKLSLDPNGYAPAVAGDHHHDDDNPHNTLNMMIHSPGEAAELLTTSDPVAAAAAAATTADILCNPISIANVAAAATATCSSSAASLIASYARAESANSGCPPSRSPPLSNALAAISQQQQLLPPPASLQQHASLSSLALSNASVNVIDDMEIKPGIAEMIREEERAKMLESSQAWLNASSSSSSSLTSDSYQYQLQSMWQKCWNTNQSLVQNLRFRERGPLKSWRPETMAEAILSVLKEGLSLSQAARKYDIPYPTFVLYANRVHNMLGPSIDGGSDLRPKGRGRPQRILLGYWPEDHIQNVIRAVVFRDPQHIKDEPLNLGYSRLSCFQEPLGIYGSNNSCLNSPEPPVSPNSTAAAAAVVAMAQGLRHQILAAAAAASSTAAAAAAAAAAHHTNSDNNNFGAPYLPPQYANGSHRLLMTTGSAASTNTITTSAAAAATTTPLPSPASTPPVSPLSNENVEVGVATSGVRYTTVDDNFPVKSENELLFHDEIEDLVIKSPPLAPSTQQHPLPPSSLSPHLREATPSNEQQPKPLSVALEQRID